jgi:CMP-N-acetylneuraminic acid synthetase
MYKRKRILALIPARGGSKGLPGKNIRPLLGKPLIAWTIEQALESKYIDKVIVSTDSAEIARVSKKSGADVPFIRPKRLATDTSKVIDTVFHAIEELEKEGLKFDYLVLLESTSPLRKEGDLDNAIKKLIDHSNKADSIISVGEIALEHPIYAKKISNGFIKSYFSLDKTDMQRQELPAAYFPYGVVYLSKLSTMRKKRAVYAGRILPYVIERWQNYEINDILDFVCVESILRYRREEKK